MRCQPSVSGYASDVINSVHSESDTTNDSSLTEPEIGGVLSRFWDQIIDMGKWVVTRNVHYGTFRCSGIFQNIYFVSWISNSIPEQLNRSKISLSHRGLEHQSVITDHKTCWLARYVTTHCRELFESFFLSLTQERKECHCKICWNHLQHRLCNF